MQNIYWGELKDLNILGKVKRLADFGTRAIVDVFALFEISAEFLKKDILRKKKKTIQ